VTFFVTSNYTTRWDTTAADCQVVIMDLEACLEINSAAFGHLLMFQRKLRKRGREIIIAKCSAPLLDLFEELQLGDMIRVPQLPGYDPDDTLADE
jgi:ABC-type transporter Mla MlaB component